MMTAVSASTRRRLACLALSTAMLTGVRAGAHHAYAAYQQDAVVVLEGTVQAMQFSDPHTLLQINALDGSYVVEWRAASQLASMGIDETTFRVNDYLVLTGSPSVNPRAKRMSLVTEVFRPSDGWQWQVVGGELTIRPPSDSVR